MAEQTLEQNDNRLVIPELSRRARARRVLAVALFFAAAAGAYAYYAQPEPVPELYRTDAVARGTLVHRIEATGNLDVRSRVEVPAPVPGRLIEIAAHTGATVEAGQVLAKLDERAGELALRSAQASLRAAKSNVAQARVSLDAAEQDHARATRLLARGLGSARDVEQAARQREAAKGALRAARAELELSSQNVAAARLSKSFGKIVAPRGGIVLRAPERLGAAVSPERGPLFVIGEPLDVMRVDVAVSESDIAQVKPGQRAEVTVPALPGVRFDAKVETRAIDPRRESGLVLYPVTLRVDNREGHLLPGMSARVRLEVARVEDALSAHDAALRFAPPGLPTDAEPSEPSHGRVYRRIGPDEVEPVEVVVGISDGVRTQISPLDGQRLSEGDPLVIGLLRPDDPNNKPKVSLGRK